VARLSGLISKTLIDLQDNPERSTIDQLVDDLLDRLSAASPDTRERIEAKLERLLAEHDHLKSPDDFLQGHQQQEH
jgi:hypothetical protein